MAQRNSGYQRISDEQYETVAWPVHALFCHLPRPQCAWDPCDRGNGRLIDTLHHCKIDAVGTAHDFLQIVEPPTGVDLLVTNPPYGECRRGELAVAFIEHALTFELPCIAMLLRVDFDSAITRQHLFRNEPRFAFKLVLLNRIKWFEGPNSPSDNHSWFVWRQDNEDAPTIRYVSKKEALAAWPRPNELPSSDRRFRSFSDEERIRPQRHSGRTDQRM
jgi:hypothetical protein